MTAFAAWSLLLLSAAGILAGAALVVDGLRRLRQESTPTDTATTERTSVPGDAVRSARTPVEYPIAQETPAASARKTEPSLSSI
jgi:hypothetical protein